MEVISCYSTKSVIEIIMALIMVGSLVGIFIRSLVDRKGKITKTDKNGIVTITEGKTKGIGARVIQFTSVCFVIPGIIILGLESKLQSETIATIMGSLIGFVLSGIANYDNKKNE